MRRFAALGLAAVCLPLCGGGGVAQAQDYEREYTGLAVTWTFGGERATDADLSLGRLHMSIDAAQDANVLHLPLFQVPLVQQGHATIAPLRALAATLGLFDGDAPASPAPPAPACAGPLCGKPVPSLPDLAD